MVLGIGIDIIEIPRVERLLEKWGESFLKRVFLPEEIAYCREKKYPAPHYAARIAVKEAVLKSFGEGWTEKIGWKDILVRRSLKGQPRVELIGKGKSLQAEMGVETILVSLSHADSYSVAVAVLSGKTVIGNR
jgi:holo-[acyl-carrier protein] synthase